MKYKYVYEYRDFQGKLRQVYDGTVYFNYNDADEALSIAISKAEAKGYHEVQGSVIEEEE